MTRSGRDDVPKNRVALAAAAAALIVGIALTVALWPTDIASFRCADGSSLSIRDVTYGTNHVWMSERWHPSVRGSSSWRRVWESFRDRFRSPPDRLRRSVPLEWKTKSSAIALWGAWDGRSEQPHALRFVLVEGSGGAGSPLRMHMPVFRMGATEGLIATITNITNLPATRRLRVRVLEDNNGGDGHRTLGEFVVRMEDDGK